MINVSIRNNNHMCWIYVEFNNCSYLHDEDIATVLLMDLKYYRNTLINQYNAKLDSESGEAYFEDYDDCFDAKEWVENKLDNVILINTLTNE